MTGAQPAPDLSGISDDAPVTALIPAAGTGTRMQCECPKQYLIIAGKTILEHTLAILLEHPRITQVVVALHPQDTVFSTLPVARHPRSELSPAVVSARILSWPVSIISLSILRKTAGCWYMTQRVLSATDRSEPAAGRDVRHTNR